MGGGDWREVEIERGSAEEGGWPILSVFIVSVVLIAFLFVSDIYHVLVLFLNVRA